jgi:uncharacterized protein
LKPRPVADRESAPYWEAARRGKLASQHCASCAAYVFPPRPYCPQCHDNTLRWATLSGNGRIWSYAVMRTAFVTGFTPPYVIARIELDEQAGLFLDTNVVQCPIESVRIGMPVTVTFEDRGDGFTIPQFRPADNP